jgi:DnaJ-class molecular chaperone
VILWDECEGCRGTGRIREYCYRNLEVTCISREAPCYDCKGKGSIKREPVDWIEEECSRG